MGRRAPFSSAPIDEWLQAHGDASSSQGPRHAPDLSYGPSSTTPGTVLPQGVPAFDDFQTIKIQVGVMRQWGVAPGQLDWMAIQVWAHTPGVEYVVCVKFERDYGNPEFKLYDTRAMPQEPPAPTPIAAPSTVLQFDSRRVLGLPPLARLPVGFPATLSLDVYAPLRRVMPR